MLVTRWTYSRGSLLRLGQRLLSDFDQSTGETPANSSMDSYYGQEADIFLRDHLMSPASRTEVETPSEVEKPTVVVPVEVKMPEIEGESDVDRIIRSHNSSLHNLQGQVIVGRVVSVGHRDVSVDLGWKDHQIFIKSELALSQIYRHSTKKKRKEGDFRPGDELRFRIEEVGTPYGEMFVSTQKMRSDVRQRLIWNELKEAYKKGVPISGRVLNPSNAGYAIGVAGFVGFCPLNRLSPNSARKIGVLRPFLVDLIGEKVGHNLVVTDPNIQFGAVRGRPSTMRPTQGMLSRFIKPLA